MIMAMFGYRLFVIGYLFDKGYLLHIKYVTLNTNNKIRIENEKNKHLYKIIFT